MNPIKLANQSHKKTTTNVLTYTLVQHAVNMHREKVKIKDRVTETERERERDTKEESKGQVTERGKNKRNMV